MQVGWHLAFRLVLNLLDFGVEKVLLAQKRSVPFVNDFPDVLNQFFIKVNQLRDFNS